MNSYFLYISSIFKDRSEIESFCGLFIEEVKSINSMKVIIDNVSTIILVFDSETENEKVSEEINKFLITLDIKMSFLFDVKSLINIKIPDEVKNIIFTKTPDDSILFMEITTFVKEHNLDDILEKIDRLGIKSLTKSEKKFLDNFKK